MHKTKTGRWQPDPPAKLMPEPTPEPTPEPAHVHDRTFDGLIFHRYGHHDAPRDHCCWCRSCQRDESSNPFLVIQSLNLNLR